MKQQIKLLLIISICFLVIHDPAWAALSDNAQDQKLERLQRQLEALQSEVVALKKANKTRHKVSHKAAHNFSYSVPKPRPVPYQAQQRTTAEIATLGSRAQASEAEEARIERKTPTPIDGPSDLPTAGIEYFPYDVDVPGQSFVSTGPYIGVPLQYSGSNLIVNSPSVNEDVALLNIRKNINQRLAAIGLKPRDERTHLLLSGVVEGQAMYKSIGPSKNTTGSSSSSASSNSTNFDLTSVGIDAYVLGTQWTSALISLNYDNGIGATSGSFSNYARSQNSRVVVNKAFIVIGDFTQTPFYGTLGQMYVPFGTYGSTMISSPLTKFVGRVQARALLAGYQQQKPCAWYGSLFAFRGDSYAGTRNQINNGGFNLGYKFDKGYYTGNLGGSVIANIADAQGMQNNGFSVVPITFPPTPPVFTGFGGVSGSGMEKLVHRVPGYDVRGLLSFGKTIDLLGEYVFASTTFNRGDMTMKSHQAKPRALNLELAYTIQGLCKPVSISAGYGMTKDALALGLPAQRYSAVVNTSLFRNTMQSLEFRHDINYAASAYATGSGIPAPRASGNSDNVLTAQFDIYF